MQNKISRRTFLLSSGIYMLGASAWLNAAAASIANEDVRRIFTHGIASGEPTESSILLWTRVSDIFGSDTVNLEWQLSKDIAFSEIVKAGTATASGQRDFCVKVNVDGLEQGSTYYYRFSVNHVFSEIGRTKTLSSGHTDQLNMAVVSCSNYPFGFFNAYDDIARDSSIDVVLHLGDYIYEYGPDGYGASVGRQIGREHMPPKETITLTDYRVRHAQYKSDPASRLMHAAHPLIAIWDDHESANNPYKSGAQNHQPDTEGDWLERRKSSLQAYFEWMPVNDPLDDQHPEKMWRQFSFGNLATLVTLETRHTGRDLQVDYGQYLPDIKDQKSAQDFIENILNDPDRAMLSQEMEAFYTKSLAQSDTTWRLIGNQIPMAKTNVPPIADLIAPAELNSNDPLAAERNALQVLAAFNLPIYTDTWDGYPVARENFYALNKAIGINDLVVLTGDSHSFWLNKLSDKDNNPMGIEIGTTGVTSPGDFVYFSKDIAIEMDKRLSEHNPEVLWTDGVAHGYVKLSIRHQKIDVDYVSVSTILNENYTSKVLKNVSITKSKDTLVVCD